MIINVKNKSVINLTALNRFVLRFIYEKHLMSIDEIRAMKDGLCAWAKKIELDRDLERLNEIEAEAIQKMGWMLQKEDEGFFENRKKLFRDKGIDWRKFHRIPEAYTQRDFEIAKELAEKDRKEYGY